jgi:hypothetical protein
VAFSCRLKKFLWAQIGLSCCVVKLTLGDPNEHHTLWPLLKNYFKSYLHSNGSMLPIVAMNNIGPHFHHYVTCGNCLVLLTFAITPNP